MQKGKFTGRIENGIIYGERKIGVIKENIKKRNFSFNKCWVYTDHDSDINLLKMVGNPFAINPTTKLKELAIVKKWPVFYFKKLVG